MNILLVYPEFPETFWGFKHALKFIHKRAHTPPLGLLTVAALLPDEFETRLVDLNVQRLRRRDLAWADYVFISAMHVQQQSVRQIISRCVAGVKIVAGGPLFTHEHDQFDDVDHFVLNEAEIVLPEFLADLKRGCAKRIYRAEGFSQLKQSPRPRFELAAMKRYASMSVQYSRGCPFDCEFCDVTALFGRGTRVKTVQQIIDELDGVKRLGWRGPVFFVDDNLIGNRKHLKHQLLPALIEWQRRSGPMPFYSQVSINLADDPQLIDLMASAGFDTVFIGIETPDPDLLAACHKVQNANRDLLSDIQRIQAAGIQVQGGFIVGFDHESPSVFQRQIDFIQTSGVVTAMVGVLQALTGTRLYERLKDEARLTAQATGDNVANTTNFITTMDAETLGRGYAYVLRSLYEPKAYYQRLRVFLRQYELPKVRVRMNWRHVRAFMRSVVQLGILGRERLQYWRLLAWTIFNRPRLFSVAVTLAIMGYHHRRVCQRYFRG